MQVSNGLMVQALERQAVAINTEHFHHEASRKGGTGLLGTRSLHVMDPLHVPRRRHVSSIILLFRIQFLFTEQNPKCMYMWLCLNLCFYTTMQEVYPKASLLDHYCLVTIQSKVYFIPTNVVSIKVN